MGGGREGGWWASNEVPVVMVSHHTHTIKHLHSAMN